MTSSTEIESATLAATKRLVGIHAATVCPLKPDYSIDEEALASHIECVTRVRGIEGLLINGHAGENFLLSREEKRRVVEIARRAAGAKPFITSGAASESSLEAMLNARDAQEAGADAILVFPPYSWALGHEQSSVLAHHRHVIDGCGLPLLLYQAPVGAGAMAYPTDTLCDLVCLPRICGIKEGSWEVAAYEANRRAVKALRPDIAVLGSGDEHLLTSYLIGSEGSQVSLAAIIPEAIVALWEAASRGDWMKARQCHEAIYPLSVAIYREAPGQRATARLKACLKILGRIPSDVTRPPLAVPTAEEYRCLEKALAQAVETAWRR
jgi:4-hydroxy-tetrahydrodipicolinate synthase